MYVIKNEQGHSTTGWGHNRIILCMLNLRCAINTMTHEKCIINNGILYYWDGPLRCRDVFILMGSVIYLIFNQEWSVHVKEIGERSSTFAKKPFWGCCMYTIVIPHTDTMVTGVVAGVKSPTLMPPKRHCGLRSRSWRPRNRSWWPRNRPWLNSLYMYSHKWPWLPLIKGNQMWPHVEGHFILGQLIEWWHWLDQQIDRIYFKVHHMWFHRCTKIALSLKYILMPWQRNWWLSEFLNLLLFFACACIGTVSDFMSVWLQLSPFWCGADSHYCVFPRPFGIILWSPHI